MQTRVVKAGRMLAVVPQNHVLANSDVIHLDEIENESFVLLEEGHYNETLDAFDSNNLTPKIKYTLHDDYAIMTMVEAGLGISILSELVLRRINYNIAVIPISPPISRILAIGYKDESNLPIASKYFIEYIFSNADRLP